jgi:hypothetical protein
LKEKGVSFAVSALAVDMAATAGMNAVVAAVGLDAGALAGVKGDYPVEEPWVMCKVGGADAAAKLDSGNAGYTLMDRKYYDSALSAAARRQGPIHPDLEGRERAGAGAHEVAVGNEDADLHDGRQTRHEQKLLPALDLPRSR